MCPMVAGSYVGDAPVGTEMEKWKNYVKEIIETHDTGEIGRGTSNQDTNEYRPMPFLHTKRRGLVVDRVGTAVVAKLIDAADITDNYWRFISPEVCFNGEKMESLFKDNIYLK